jgi:hypothetical protein
VASGSVLAAAVVHEMRTLADAVPHLHTRWRKNVALRLEGLLDDAWALLALLA